MLGMKEIQEFMTKLPVRKIPGIGKSKERILEALEMRTCADIRDNAAHVMIGFSYITATFLLRAAHGLDAVDCHQSSSMRHSISREITFRPLYAMDALIEKLHGIVEHISDDLIKQELITCHITLKVKSEKFVVRNIAKPLEKRTRSAEEILSHALSCLRKYFTGDKNHQSVLLMSGDGIRLLGLRCSKLTQVDKAAEEKKRIRDEEGVIVISSSSESSETSTSPQMTKLRGKRRKFGPIDRWVQQNKHKRNKVVSRDEDIICLS